LPVPAVPRPDIELREAPGLERHRRGRPWSATTRGVQKCPPAPSPDELAWAIR
jgi:hypothetical protein